MTYSIGFRSPSADELAQEILQRLAEDTQGDAASVLYRDPDQTAQFQSAKIPAALAAFAKTALKQSLRDPFAVQRALGSYLSEPKATVMFDASEPMAGALQSVALDRCTRMLFDSRHIFINGEAFMASGEDAKWMRILANTHALSAVQVGRLSPGALGLLQDWVDAGWVQSLG
jgi:50S ribosomal protein L16 3-hydroxylase